MLQIFLKGTGALQRWRWLSMGRLAASTRTERATVAMLGVRQASGVLLQALGRVRCALLPIELAVLPLEIFPLLRLRYMKVSLIGPEARDGR